MRECHICGGRLEPAQERCPFCDYVMPIASGADNAGSGGEATGGAGGGVTIEDGERIKIFSDRLDELTNLRFQAKKQQAKQPLTRRVRSPAGIFGTLAVISAVLIIIRLATGALAGAAAVPEGYVRIRVANNSPYEQDRIVRVLVMQLAGEAPEVVPGTEAREIHHNRSASFEIPAGSFVVFVLDGVGDAFTYPMQPAAGTPVTRHMSGLVTISFNGRALIRN